MEPLYDGINTYVLSAHGLLACPPSPSDVVSPEDPVFLPKNVLVIMNCVSGCQYVNTYTHTDQAKLFQVYMDIAFESVQSQVHKNDLNLFIENLIKISTIHKGTNQFCVFWNACPNLTLSVEKNHWRDGLFKLPFECDNFDVVTGINQHAQDGDMSMCPKSYKRFAIPAYGRPYDNTIKNGLMAQAVRQIDERETLRGVIEMIQSPKNQSQQLHVIIVHACTIHPKMLECPKQNEPYSIWYEKKALNYGNKMWLKFWFQSRLRGFVPQEPKQLEGGKQQNKKRKKLTSQA